MRTLVTVTLLSMVASAMAEPLSRQQFERIQQELQSSANEKWRSIPWRISLLEAQAIAASQQKPLFIWAMDGHPLGCT